MSKNNGKLWPYAIGVSIALVFVASIVTIAVANKLPVEKSDTYMMGYHEADDKANEIIEAEIAFNKKYKIEYATGQFSKEKSVIRYKIDDINSNPVDNAKIKVVITRPNSHKYDRELDNYSVENGVYTFDAIELPQEGRWDIMAKVNIGELQRFYNIKADTRNKDFSEY